MPATVTDGEVARGWRLGARSDLIGLAGLRRAALLSYNRSVPYGNKVLAEGSRYLSALSLPELPPATTPAVTPEG